MTPDDDAQIPPITAIRLTGAAGREALPLLVLGPSAGSSALDLWAEVAAGLDDAFDVLAWDLPGQGYNAPLPPGSPEPTPAVLAAGVARVVDDVLVQRGELGAACAHAGVGVGAEVALELLASAPERVTAAIALDDVAVPDRARVLRAQLLGESPSPPGDPSGERLDERTRALVALVAAAATGRDVAEPARAARVAGLGRTQVDEVLALTETVVGRATAGPSPRS